MIEKDINGRKVVMYDSIDELPIMRYHKFNKYIMIDSGIGENMNDVSRHLDSILTMTARKDMASIETKVNTLRQNLHFAIENVSPKSMAFAVMVKSIDGKECTDTTEFGLTKLINSLAGHGISYGMIKSTIDFLKKKSRKTLRGISRQ